MQEQRLAHVKLVNQSINNITLKCGGIQHLRVATLTRVAFFLSSKTLKLPTDRTHSSAELQRTSGSLIWQPADCFSHRIKEIQKLTLDSLKSC